MIVTNRTSVENEAIHTQGTQTLDATSVRADDSGMEHQENDKPENRNGIVRQGLRPSQGVSDDLLRNDNADNVVDMSYLTLGERIDYACKAWKTPDLTQEDMARALKVSRQQLMKMREHTYGNRGMQDWSPLKRLAVESGLSYEWLRSGRGKQPKPITEEEDAAIRSELYGAAPAQAGDYLTDPQAPTPHGPVTPEDFRLILDSVALGFTDADRNPEKHWRAVASHAYLAAAFINGRVTNEILSRIRFGTAQLLRDLNPL